MGEMLSLSKTNMGSTLAHKPCPTEKEEAVIPLVISGSRQGAPGGPLSQSFFFFFF